MKGEGDVVSWLGKSLGVVGIIRYESDIAQCWRSGIENNLGVIVNCRNRGTLITCKVQYLDAEGSIAVLAGQDGSTDFPLLAFGIYLIEFQGIQAADADIRTGRSLDRFLGLETQSDLIIFPGGGIIQVVGNDGNIQKFRFRRVNIN